MLPIRQIEGQIVAVLRAGNRLVLSAPTGSGKTTQVPQILHAHGLVQGRMVVLQPRRLATRMVAQRVASEMGVPLGGLVGYQTRHEAKISEASVIRFMTEGLLLRLFQGDPRLSDVGAVVLDEFHERSLAADACLAMVKTLQETTRPDLKMMVMSATLDVAKIAAYLDCPKIEATGRMYPVSVRYLARHNEAPVWDRAADAVAEAVAGSDEPSGEASGGGSVLVFMPGAYEIRRTIDACRARVQQRLNLFPLHGELPPDQQDAAVREDSSGSDAASDGGNFRGRKVIVATNVAETSITIPGVRHVIDSGLARVNRFDNRRGINVLLIEPISKASAEQRAGRAGRTAPGTCTRLWTQFEDKGRAAQSQPEILRLDLAEVLLWLKSLGVADAGAFPWLDRPAERALEQATATLTALGALDASGALTDRGRAMAKIPTHPRLGRMLVEAAERGCLERAALWAALISEREIILRQSRKKWADETLEAGDGTLSDLQVFERAFAAARAARFDVGRCDAMGVHVAACRQVEQVQRILLDAARGAGLKFGRPKSPAGARGLNESEEVEELIRCLIVGFPDHLAVRRGEANLACAVIGGRRGELDAMSVVKHVGPLLAVEIVEVGAGRNVRTALSMVSRVRPAWLEELFAPGTPGSSGRLRVESVLVFNDEIRAVEEVERRMFDDLVLEETARPPAPENRAAVDAASRLLAERVGRGELKLHGWDEAVDQWIARTRCVAAWFPERKLLAYDAEDLAVIREEICAGATRQSQVEDRDCLEPVKNALSWEDRDFVERMAPEKAALPATAAKGWKMKIEYQPGSPPRGRAKIQDLYDLRQTPTVAGGRVKLLLEILGPNHRPVQVTDDLAGFWKRLYPELKKELKRRYPRHEWR